jgi:hypothetical protein
MFYCVRLCPLWATVETTSRSTVSGRLGPFSMYRELMKYFKGFNIYSEILSLNACLHLRIHGEFKYMFLS